MGACGGPRLVEGNGGGQAAKRWLGRGTGCALTMRWEAVCKGVGSTRRGLMN